MKVQRENDAAAVKVFPPAIPLGAILAGVTMQHLWPIPLDFLLPTPERYFIGSSVVAVAILFLGAWSVLLMHRSGQSENPWKPTTQILDRGPFRITRNPMYLQMVIGCIGVAIFLANLWILLLTPIAALALYRWAILPEEAYLERKFGDTYLAYKGRVRRWL
jgi:protein-S-isoprenylcysteine O-methyltransferase Ste14